MPYHFDEAEDLVPAGEYEVVLSAEKRVIASSGNVYIRCKFTIRDDIEQVAKGRCVFDSIFTEKDGPNAGEFRHDKLGKIISTQGKDAQKDFQNEDELIQYINGLRMRITVDRKAPDDYNPVEHNEVRYLSYRPSKAAPQDIQPAAAPADAKPDAGTDANNNSNDMPF